MAKRDDADTAALPWERQPEEGSKPFQAFACYRDMDPGERSLAKVAKELHKSTTLMGRWSRDWKWVERVRAYDNYRDRQDQEEAAREYKKFRKRQREAGRRMQEQALEALESLSIVDYNASGLAKLIVDGAKLERESLLEEAGILNADGTPANIRSQNEESSVDWSTLTDDDLRALARMYDGGGNDAQ